VLTGFVGFPGSRAATCPGCASPPWACAAGWLALAAAGFGGFFTALAGRVRELYAQAGTAREPGDALE
jgi:uncharacterized membrane protein